MRSVINRYRIIHFAMLMGQMFFFILVMVLLKDKLFYDLDKDLMLWILALGIAVLALVLSPIIYYRILHKRMDHTDTLQAKMQHWSVACLVRFAIMEGSTLLSIILLLITANLVFAYIAAVMLILFANLMPLTSRIAIDLRLTGSDEEFLMKN